MKRALFLAAVVALSSSPIPVDARPTHKALVRGGQFNWVTPDLSDLDFLPSGRAADPADLKPFSLQDLGGKEMTKPQIEWALARKGYRPAMLSELLVYSAQGWDGKSSVIAFGSAYQLSAQSSIVPCAGNRFDKRVLDVCTGRNEYRWKGDEYFLAVRITKHKPPRTLEEMITAGHYEDIDPKLNEKNFLVSPARFTAKDAIIVTIDREMLTEDVVAEIDRRGLRPATIETLLAYGAEHPDEQRDGPIAALGSTFRSKETGEIGTPCLRGLLGGRDLGLSWHASSEEWRDSYRFLAVPK